MYGDYDGPDKPDKGQLGGSCNRTRCQAPDAVYFNHGSRSFYCADCADDLNRDEFNQRDAQRLYGHDLCTLVTLKV